MNVLADGPEMERLIGALAEDIRHAAGGISSLAFIGIRRRGDVLAQRLAANLGVTDVGSIDITLYRDDLSETGPAAKVGRTNINFDVKGRQIILCDDVLMTGRSALAGIREILDFGRPDRLRLAVLVERPEREIPIQPEHSALKIAPKRDQKIDVRLKPQDDLDQISLNTRA